MQVVDLILVQADNAGIDLVTDVEEHINERHTVVGEVANDLAVLIIFQRVACVDHLGQLVIQARHLRELAGSEPVFQHVAVHGLNVGKAAGVVHLIVAFQFFDHGCFHPVIVVLWYDESHQVGLGKVFVDHVIGDLRLIQHWRLDRAVAIGVGALCLEMVGKHQHHCKDDGNDLAGFVSIAAHERDLGHKVAVLGLAHVRAKQHQQAGHDHEDRQHGEQDGLDEADGHIRADLELHEQHGHQTADGGQGAGTDLRDTLGQRLDDRLFQGQGLVFFFKMVAEDDGVVQRKGQLQNVRDRVGNERDGAQQEVGAHVEDHAHHESEQQHGNFRIGLGGEDQHHHNDDGNIHHDDIDFTLNRLLLRIAQRGGNVDIVVFQVLLDAFQRFQALVVVLGIIECDGVQRRYIIIMGGGIIVLDHLDAPEARQLVVQLVCLVRRDVCHHDIGRTVGGKLFFHNVQAHAGLAGLGQIGGQVAFHLDPAAGEDGEDGSQNDDEEHKVAPLNNLQRELVHKIVFGLFLLGHRVPSSRHCITGVLQGFPQPSYRWPAASSAHLLLRLSLLLPLPLLRRQLFCFRL